MLDEWDTEVVCKVLEKELDRLLDEDVIFGEEQLRDDMELALLKARKFLKHGEV